MFWGLILEPYKRYSQTVSKAFHISNAALDSSTGDNDMCQVMVGAQGKEFLICTLQKGKNLQTPLDLYFKEGSEISFSSSGKGVIHLTGYLDPELYEDGEETESDMEDDDEIPELTPIDKKKRKAETSPVATLTKKMKKELEKNKKTAKKSKEDSMLGDDDDDDSEDDDDEEEGKDYLAKLLQDDESDANDESYIPNETSEVSLADSDDEDEDEDDDDEDDDDSDEDSDEKSSPQVSPAKGQKQKKDKKADKPQQNGFAEKNKANKENEQKPSHEEKIKKVLPGNVAIEDLKVGQGAPAKSGKMVQVYYEGRLKSNNKMFDSCLKGPGFKFKLGKKEVIPGWDVGVAGMKVGGKRRIVCPPGMAYGKKGSPPVIPPNSTLVFEVELKGIN